MEHKEDKQESSFKRLFKRLLKNIQDFLINKSLDRILAIATPFIVGFSAKILAESGKLNFINLPLLIEVSIALLIIGIVIIYIIILWKLFGGDFFDWFMPPRLSYKFLRKDFYYTYKSPTKYTATKVFKIKVLKDGFKIFTDRFGWAVGRNPKITPVLTDNVKFSLTEPYRRSFFRYYDIVFNDELKKNQTPTVKVNFDFNDPGKDDPPILSSKVSVPTDLLGMHIDFDGVYNPNEVIYEIYKGNVSDGILVSQQGIPIYKNNKLDYEIRNPKQGYSYLFKWNTE